MPQVLISVYLKDEEWKIYHSNKEVLKTVTKEFFKEKLRAIIEKTRSV